LDVGDIIRIALKVSGVAGKDTWQPEWIEITNEKTKESWTFDISNVLVNEDKTYGPYYPK